MRPSKSKTEQNKRLDQHVNKVWSRGSDGMTKLEHRTDSYSPRANCKNWVGPASNLGTQGQITTLTSIDPDRLRSSRELLAAGPS
jgi:hypothetical protein